MRAILTNTQLGFIFAIGSALCFGISGALGKSLYDIGWSPGGVVTFRIVGTAILLALPAVRAMRGNWHAVRTSARTILVYGLISVAGVQFFYFTAVVYLPVAIALLLEMTAPVLVVLFFWATTRVRPGKRTLIGAAVAMAGTVLILDLGNGAGLHPVGVLLGLCAAVCLASYYLVSAKEIANIPQVALIGLGMAVASIACLVLALTRVLPIVVTTGTAAIGALPVPWWVPITLLIVSTVGAYIFGVAAIRRLGAQLASFVGLCEILVATLASWLILGEMPTGVQALGGLGILAGVVLIRLGEPKPDAGGRPPRRDVASEQQPATTA